MKCPYCGHLKTEVVSGFDTEKGKYQRWRKCQKCGRRFKSFETIRKEDADGIQF